MIDIDLVAIESATLHPQALEFLMIFIPYSLCFQFFRDSSLYIETLLKVPKSKIDLRCFRTDR